MQRRQQPFSQSGRVAGLPLMPRRWRFEEAVAELARSMGLEPPAKADLYALEFDAQTRLHLLPGAHDRFDIMCEAGGIENPRAAELLLRLLALGDPPVSLRVEPETARVVVWARCDLNGFDAGSFADTVRQVLDTVAAARRCLDGQQA